MPGSSQTRLGPKSQAVIERTHKYSANHYHRLPVVFVRGEGVRLWDLEGREYIDMLGTYSALNVGHCHPRILNVLREQAGLLANVSNAVYTPQYADFVENLAKFCFLDKVLPKNGGVEAWESAVKIARAWGYGVKGVDRNKAEIIVCDGAFHGRTLAAISATQKCGDKFGPSAPGFVSVPFGDTDAFENAVTKNTVAFVVEPIQGEGGINIPPEGYLNKVSYICLDRNVLFVLDEIQTGFCRTGNKFAFWHQCLSPDLLIVGKALSGGFLPISAVVGTKEAMDAIKPGDDGSTFGGNPLACAVAVEALKVLEEERLADRALLLGEYFISQLKGLDSSLIKEVRGRGLMIGIEFQREHGLEFRDKMLEAGVLCKETRDNVIRFAPPLTITKEEIDSVLNRTETVLRQR
ncbi:MAG: ornithine--oxo-acid transaminase [Candidatus Yanofskybacteria bacterium]|nr:ornithine--oxo-acid transaminase [Candidatus Yanofskybacteria bacterium]